MPDVGLIPDNTATMMGNLVPQQGQAGGALQQNIGALNNMMQLKQNQMQLQAKLALGPLSQAAIDPKTGQMDYNKFGMLVSSDPRTAFIAPDILNGMVQRQLTQAQTLKETLMAGNEAQKVVGNQLAGLMSKGASVTKDDVAQAISELRGSEAGRMIFPSDAAAIKYLQGLPAGGPQLQQFVKAAVLRSAAAQNNFDQVLGKWSPIDLGGKQGFYKTQGGDISMGGTLAKTPTTEELNRPTTTVGPSGEKSVHPQGQVMPMLNGGGGVETSPGDGSGAAPPPGSVPAAPGAGGPAPGSPPPARNVTELGQAQQDLNKMQWQGADKYQEELAKNNSASVNVAALTSQAEDALSKIKTGGGGNVRAEVGSMLQGLKAAGVPIDEKSIDKVANGGLAASQEFKKLMMQLATQLMTESLRGGGRFTNLEYSNFQQSNPNLDTDPRAVKDMLGFIKKMAGLSLQEQQHFNSYQQEALDPSKHRPGVNYSLPDWHSRWNNYLIKSGVLKAKADE